MSEKGVSEGQMNIGAMRKVDSWLGVPVCFLLTIICKLLGKSGITNLGPIRKILFVKPAEQGATVLAFPAIQRAVEMVGRENVYFIVFEKNRSILDVMEVIPEENVIAISTRGMFRVLIGFWRAIAKIRKEKIDTAIDFEFFSRASAAICYLSGARRRVGLHSFTGESPYRGKLMTHPIPYNCRLHISDTFFILVDSVDVPVDKLPALDF